jgi:hypothetical protein
MPVFRLVVSLPVSCGEELLFIASKAGPAGGCLRRPSSRRNDTTGNRGTGRTQQSP